MLCCYLHLRTCKHGLNISLLAVVYYFYFYARRFEFLPSGSDTLVDFSIPCIECDNFVFVDRGIDSVRIACAWMSSASICITSSIETISQLFEPSNLATLSTPLIGLSAIPVL